MSVCVVLSCQSKYEPGRIYHRFPPDLSRRNQWFKCLGLTNMDINSSSAVCSKHFRTKDYYPGLNRLLPDTVPLLRLGLRKSETKDRKLQKTMSQMKRTKEQNIVKIRSQSAVNLNVSIKDKNSVNPSIKNKTKPLPVVPSMKAAVPKEMTVTEHCVHGKKARRKSAPAQPTAVRYTEPLFAARQKTLRTYSRENKTTPNRKTNIQQRDQLKAEIDEQERSRSTMAPRAVLSLEKLEPTTELAASAYKDSKKPNTKTQTKRGRKRRVASPEKLIENIQEKFKNAWKKAEETTKKSPVIVPPKTKIVIKTDKNELQTNSASSTRAVKRSFEKTNAEPVKRRRLLAGLQSAEKAVIEPVQTRNSSKPHKNSLIQDQTSSDRENINADITHTNQKQVSPRKDNNIADIASTILEMQSKIENLEKKSILDEQRIDRFKKALIQLRKNDIKLLMDDKENELLLRMDLLYLDYDPQRICRLCLLLVEKNESLHSLFWPRKNQSLISLIQSTTSVQILPEEGMPSGVCNACLQQMKNIDWIRRRTQRSNCLIKKFLSLKKVLNENNCGTSLIENSAALEKLQFSDDLFEEEQPSLVKIEDVFSLDNSPEVDSFDQQELPALPLKREAEFDQEIGLLAFNEEVSVIRSTAPVRKLRECRRCEATFTNHWSLKNHMKYCKKIFQCSECTKRFWNRELFKKHKQRRVSCACVESRRCCFQCDLVFRWKWQLVFHVLYHNTTDCEICGEVFQSFDELAIHVMTSHLND